MRENQEMSGQKNVHCGELKQLLQHGQPVSAALKIFPTGSFPILAYFWLPHEKSTDTNWAYLVYLDDNIKDVISNESKQAFCRCGRLAQSRDYIVEDTTLR